MNTFFGIGKKNVLYYWFAALAYLRGFLGHRWPPGTSCTTGLNGPGEARAMYVRHGWIPWCYVRTRYGWSRTFLTNSQYDE